MVCKHRVVTVAIGVVVVSSCGGAPNAPTLAGGNAQITSVRGRVVDTLLTPVAGASVTIVKGPAIGATAITGEDGWYTIPAVAAGADLVGVTVVKDRYLTGTDQFMARAAGYTMLTPARVPDVLGTYSLTFTAAASCTQLPLEYRSLTVTATVSKDPYREVGFYGRVTDAESVPLYNEFQGTVALDTARFQFFSSYAYERWLYDAPILKRDASGALIGVMGGAVVENPTPGIPVVTEFSGLISYCAAPGPFPGPDYPPYCVMELRCESSHHQLTLTRH